MADLTHLDEHGAAHMVDVGGKAVTRRVATASGRITMSDEALDAIRRGNTSKGDVLGTARIAGIMAAKQTANLIPLCHPLPLDQISIDLAIEAGAINATASVSVAGRTGVEMEALTGVTVALLTLYDMAKALDKSMVIQDVRLLAKTGGSTGKSQPAA